MEILNGDDGGLKCLGVSHLHDLGMYKANSKYLPNLIRTMSKFVKNQTIPALFYTPTFHTSSETFLGRLRAVFVDLLTDLRVR